MLRFIVGLLIGAGSVIGIQALYQSTPADPSDRALADGRTPLTTSDYNASEEQTKNGQSSSAAGLGTHSILQENLSTGALVTSAFSVRPTANQNASGEVEDEPEALELGPSNPIRLPKTHEGFVSKKPHSVPDAHAELEREAVDDSWAGVVEGLIATHIGTHPEGHSIGLISLQCRTTRCEIVGTAYGEGGAEAWRAVRESMQQQSWYGAYFTPSSLESGGSFAGEYRFVSIFARIGHDIVPPVDP